MNRVIVVESGAKTKTIRSFLRGEYSVIACGGHIVDLPEDDLGIDVDDDFSFHLEPLSYRGNDKVSRVREQLEDADEIYLATDPDREGEAIAADLLEFCVDDDVPVYRIEFNAIVYQAVQEALENPRDIDEDRVEAQRARRVLDRLIGFTISAMAQFDPEGPGCPSVGRVLAPAVSLVVDRENEIRNFETRKYWELKTDLQGNGTELEATLDQELEEFDQAQDVVSSLKDNGSMTVRNCEVDPEDTYNPLPPYTTDSLQNEADYLLDFSPERTMALAQELYQGVEIDGNPQALITYMRTDSTRLSPSALNLASETMDVRDDLDEDLYQGRTWQPQGAEQDAHEAIRPTVPNEPEYFPDNLEGKIDDDLLQLYRLIYVRFLASQMKPAVYQKTTLDLESGDHTATAVGYEMDSPGFLPFYRTLHPDHGREETDVPSIEAGTDLSIEKIWPEPRETHPPARYREGSLVSELKDRGIGRPSTYGDILTKIKKGSDGFGYVTKVRGTLRPTDRGEDLCEYLHEKFPEVISYEYTAGMERELEKIEDGENDYETFLKNEFNWLKETYEYASEKGWMSGERPTPAQVEFLRNLSEETGTNVPESVFESRDEVSEWIDKLQDEITPRVKLSEISPAMVGDVECYRFRLSFNQPLPEEEKEYLKDKKMKYKQGEKGQLPAYQFQRQDRQVVEDLWEELKERYSSSESPLEAEFQLPETA
ncbi:MAG: type I DNA topoisomerase [bacterium]